MEDQETIISDRGRPAPEVSSEVLQQIEDILAEIEAADSEGSEENPDIV